MKTASPALKLPIDIMMTLVSIVLMGGQSITRDKNGNFVLVYHYYDRNNDGKATGTSLGWVYDSDWDWNSFIDFQKEATVTVALIIGDAGANITYCE